MRVYGRQLATIVGIAAVVAIASGCTEASTMPPTETTVSAHMARELLPDIHAVVSEVKANDGIAVIATAESSVEAPGNATPDGVEIQKGDATYIPATRTTLKVTSVLFGTSEVSSTINVRQHGAPNVKYSELLKLRDGNEYLVFLKPFRYTPTSRTGDWVVVGLDAVWKRTSNGAFDLVKSGDTESRYPATMTAETVERLFLTS